MLMLLVMWGSCLVDVCDNLEMKVWGYLCLSLAIAHLIMYTSS